jgi:hypothetical protein
MKKTSVRAALFLAMLLMIANAVSAQHYVRVQPVRPQVAANRPPGHAGYVWVDEDWRWANGRYMWAGGRWVRPPYRGAAWIPGRWVRTRYGLQWMPGHWRKRQYGHH